MAINPELLAVFDETITPAVIRMSEQRMAVIEDGELWGLSRRIQVQIVSVTIGIGNQHVEQKNTSPIK